MGSPVTNTRSLSFRINTAIWTVCAAVLLAFSLFFYAYEKNQRRSQIELAKVLLSTVYLQNHEELANEIFAGHTRAVAYILMDITKVKGIGTVSIFDAAGNLLEAVGARQFRSLDMNTRLSLENGPTYEEIRLGNRPHIAFYTTIEVIGERQGYFIACFDLSDLYHASRMRLLLIVGVFGGMLLTLSLVLHHLLIRLVVQPVWRLRDAMDRVMQGHLGEQVSLSLKNEIGEVADSFNAMSLQLREQHQRLNRSIEARDSYAAQLEETNRKLARLNADLESIVEDRTRELRSSYEKLQTEIQERQRAYQEKSILEERLVRSQKMEALGLLAGGVAHDLNNVLSGIVSYPELILMDLPPEDPMRHMIETVQRSGQKAAAIVQDLLALARRGVTSMIVLDLNRDVIHDYLDSPEFQKLTAYHPGVALETHLATDLMNIRGSAIHLRKAFMNLISNAAEAQPEGGTIIVKTENRYVDIPVTGYDRVHEGDYVVLIVEDRGSGIPMEDLNRIFEPFYTKKVMGRSGTGLGMSVIWGTVQDHNGYINVESKEGLGTRFELYFPVTREKMEAPVEAFSREKYSGRGETVLVIDDVEEQREIAFTLLNRLGYKVVVMPSGEAALEYLKAHTADILVLDMIMAPGMDGLETYSRIIDTHPGQKAVIASGYAENERVKAAQRLGAGAYIRKPYTLEKIAMAIRKELERPNS
ncbi:MAG: ATP-binding protein [Thermodesulfobacteriota bacterium]